MPRRLWALALVATVVAASCSSSDTATKDTPAPTGTGTTTPATSTKPGHVFVINLENKGYTETFGDDSKAPYLSKELITQGQLLTQYHGIAHASLGNYLAQISGQAPNPDTQADCASFNDFVGTEVAEYDQLVGSGCVYPASVQTIAGQMDGKGLSWKGYMEDMGNGSPLNGDAVCQYPTIGEPDPTHAARPGNGYATRHNPFMYFHSVIDDPANCYTHVVPLNRLEADLASADTTPKLAYITPNLCNDGHDAPCVDGQPGGLTSADEFLKSWVPRITSSPAFKEDGLLIITFDEAELVGDNADSSACCGSPTGPNTDKPGITGPGGGRTGTVIIGATVKAGTVNDTPYNHYALLCSIEELFGLDKLGLAAVPGLACFGPDVYNNLA